MMHINDYRFGSMMIDGVLYTDDVEVRSNGDVLSWQCVRNHIIDLEDISNVLEHGPDLLIIGAGYSKKVEMTDKAKKELESNRIQMIIDKTEAAVELFNSEVEKEKSVIGLFHLTC